MALAEQADLIVRLSLKDNLTRGVTSAQRGLRGLDASTQRTQKSLGTFARNLTRIAGGLVVGFVGGAALAIRAASSFESQLNTINTVARVSQEELDGIGETLRRTARESGQSLDDLTKGYYDLVSAGIAAEDAQGVLNAAVTLGIGGLATTTETVDLLTTAINAYGLDASEAAEVADKFAQAIGAGKVTAAELAGSFAQVAPLAASLGIEIDELAAGYAQLTARGIPAAEASTNMRSALVALQRTTPELERAQRKLKVSFADIAAEEGLAEAYRMIVKYAKDTNTPLIELLGKVEAQGYALAVTGRNAEDYAENLRLVQESSEGAGVATEQATERQKGLAFQWQRLKRIGGDLAITFGTVLLPPLTKVVTKVNALVEAKQGEIAKLAERIGRVASELFTDTNVDSGIRKALDFLKDLPYATMAEGLRITGQAAKIAIDAFKSLPPDMQKLLIGVLAANKLTGGLVTSVIGDLAGVALRSLTTIHAANVTVVGANVTGGVPGVAGTTGGVAGTVLSGVAKVTLVGAAATLLVAGVDAIGTRILEDQGYSQEQIEKLNLISTLNQNLVNSAKRGYPQPVLEARIAALRAEVGPPLNKSATNSAATVTRLGAMNDTYKDYGQRISERTNALKAAVDEAKRSFDAGYRRLDGTLRAKKMSVSIRNTMNVRISARQVVSETDTFTRWGGVTVA